MRPVVSCNGTQTSVSSFCHKKLEKTRVGTQSNTVPNLSLSGIIHQLKSCGSLEAWHVGFWQRTDRMRWSLKTITGDLRHTANKSSVSETSRLNSEPPPMAGDFETPGLDNWPNHRAWYPRY